MTPDAPLRVALESALHRGNAGDVAFYRAACAGARGVLELGCGVGRVGGALADDGLEVAGIDLDRAALKVAAARGVWALCADMRAFELGRRFERIIVPFSGLYCLLSAADTLRCLSRIRTHLTPGGYLLLDVYAADAFHAQPGDEAFDEEAPVATVEACDTTWEVLERSRWWRERQRIDAWYRFVSADGGAALCTVIRQRYLLRHQVADLLRRAGLAAVAFEGDFEGGAYEVGSELMVIRARA
jgi:SAM-dependent methyltransferase